MAKKLGDVLMVGINSDASVRANKGSSRPIVPEKERAELVASLEAVDYVFMFGGETPTSWLSKIKPSVHVKGSDRKIEEIPERHIISKRMEENSYSFPTPENTPHRELLRKHGHFD